jgi:putative tryptophan/tyrosine transport system substrate-binding protein
MLVAGIGGIAAWPLVARAEKQAMPVIGFLSARSSTESAALVAAFRRGLSELGYVEGESIRIEYYWADNRLDRLPQLAADLVRRQVAVIAAVTTPGALTVKAATSKIPIVFVAGGDPVKLGLVGSLNRPDGNVTGVSLVTFELLRKRMELICELVPNEATMGLLVNPANTWVKFPQQDVEDAARSLKRQIVFAAASSGADLELAFAKLVDKRAGMLVVSPDSFFDDSSKVLGALAAKHRIPAVAEVREFAVAGGLASYGTDFADAYRQAGVYAGGILKGSKTVQLPVLQPTKFDLTINLKTAKALGITVPLTIQATADDVIE